MSRFSLESLRHIDGYVASALESNLAMVRHHLKAFEKTLDFS